MKKRILLAACCLCLLPTAPAFAQRQKSTVPDLNAEGKRGEIARLQFRKMLEKFDSTDEDKDGDLSKDEATRHFNEYDMGRFAERDKNNDGRLSWEEFVGHDRWKKDALK